MKKNPDFKFGYSQLFALVAALALPMAVSAADSTDSPMSKGESVEKDVKKLETGPVWKQQGDPSSRGMQGPKRSDMLGESPVERTRDGLSQDMQKGLYPMGNGVGIP